MIINEELFIYLFIFFWAEICPGIDQTSTGGYASSGGIVGGRRSIVRRRRGIVGRRRGIVWRGRSSVARGRRVVSGQVDTRDAAQGVVQVEEAEAEHEVEDGNWNMLRSSPGFSQSDITTTRMITQSLEGPTCLNRS